MTEKVQYKKKLAAAMASCAFLVFGALSLLSSAAVNLDSITNVLIKTFPAIITLGFLGYFMGNIFDHRKGNIKKLILQSNETNEETEYPESMFASSDDGESDEE